MRNVLVPVKLVARGGLWFGGAVILACALLISTDIVLRVVFNQAIDGTDELARFALAISTTWALAGALLDRAHIRVDTAYAQFPGEMRLACDFAALLAFLIFFSLILVYGIEMIHQSWTVAAISDSALQLPMVLPQTIWILGIILFLLADVALLVVAGASVLRGDVRKAAALIGMKTAEEEVQEELAATPVEGFAK